MATKRTAVQDKAPLGHAEVAPLGRSNIAPAVPKEVIMKLLFFTFAMIFAPISSYFLTLNTLYSGNSTWAGATAAIVANVVLLGYIIVAFKEDQADRAEAENDSKKAL